MKDGFLKVAAATVKIDVANIRGNVKHIQEKILLADQMGVNLLVLPELCVTGYTCGDLFFSDSLLSESRKALQELADFTAGKYPIVFVGLPLSHNGKIYNSAAALFNGRILGIVPKTALPNYGEFYEKRYFESGSSLPAGSVCRIGNEEVPFGNRLIFRHDSMEDYAVGIEICEDLWAPEPVSTGLCRAGALLIVNPSASDETLGKSDYRRTLVSSTSARLLCGYVYSGADSSESTGDMVFSRHAIVAENGKLLAENKPFEKADITVTEIDVAFLAGERRKNTSFRPADESACTDVFFHQEIQTTRLTREIEPTPFVPANNAAIRERAEAILTIQSYGLKKRVEHTNAKKLVIGISGGLDSTLALLASVRAMEQCGRPVSDIIAVTMPCFGTTQRTKSNAVRLCELLGVTLREIDITRSTLSHFADIGQDPKRYDVTFENGQARERTQVLMDIANMEGGLVVGTGDLSELALGWATYNGDHMSMYGINASVPKTLVRFIVQYEADRFAGELGKVLRDILDTPVSPELLPASADGGMTQKTEDLVGPYELHDFFLYHTLRLGEGSAKIYRLAKLAFAGVYPDEVIQTWLKVFIRRFFAQQFKRTCLPDGPKVGSVTLSPRGDWRMPSDASAALWLESLEQEIANDKENAKNGTA